MVDYYHKHDKSIDLISIEYSEDSEPNETQQVEYPRNFNSEKEFQDEILKLKQKSSEKFKTKWEEILHKYSQIDDELESDEIDIMTGKVTVDNGHLKSLKREPNEIFNDNVWSIEYDKERDIKNLKQRELSLKSKKSKLKQELKASNQFTIPKSTPVKPRKVSQDNILLLDPSPTKKQKISPTKCIENFNHVNDSPTRRTTNDLSLSSDSELELDDVLPTSTPKNETMESALSSEDDYTHEGEELSNLTHVILLSSEGETETDKDEVDESDEEIQNERKRPQANPFLDESNLINSQNSIDLSIDYATPTAELSESSDFDDQYSIINSPYLYIKTTKTQILKCYFNNCSYTTGNKMIFKSHLLSKHLNELYLIGYPIAKHEITATDEELKKYHITTLLVKSITQHFPLIHEVPPLPLSGDQSMFKCGLALKKKFCKREFVSANELNYHQDNFPFKCSNKIQVYVCPVLGCGFMTDEGYLPWRDHFLEQKHYIERGPNTIIDDDTIIEKPTILKEIEQDNRREIKNELLIHLELTPGSEFEQRTDLKQSNRFRQPKYLNNQKLEREEKPFQILNNYKPAPMNINLNINIDDEIEQLFKSDEE